jgi:hypothetical protein
MKGARLWTWGVGGNSDAASGKISRLVSVFIEASMNLKVLFETLKMQKKHFPSAPIQKVMI